MPSLCNPRQNKILGGLPIDEFTRLLPFLELVDLPHGHVIHERGATLGKFISLQPLSLHVCTSLDLASPSTFP